MFEEENRKFKIKNSTKIEEKVGTFFRRCLKGEIDDVEALIDRSPSTKEELSKMLVNFILQVSYSKFNYDEFDFSIESLDENLSFVILEKKNNVRIKHAAV